MCVCFPLNTWFCCRGIYISRLLFTLWNKTFFKCSNAGIWWILWNVWLIWKCKNKHHLNSGQFLHTFPLQERVKNTSWISMSAKQEKSLPTTALLGSSRHKTDLAKEEGDWLDRVGVNYLNYLWPYVKSGLGLVPTNRTEMGWSVL